VPYPTHVAQLLDYLENAMESKPSKSLPSSVAAALSVIESAGQVPVQSRFSLDPVWKSAVEHWTSKATVDHTEVKRAELYTTAMVLSLELAVVDVSRPIYYRALCWAILIMLWGCLRVDDLMGLDHTRMLFTPAGFQAIVTRTKTTGPGKKVTELPVFIHVDANLTGSPWLEAGFEIWNSPAFSFDRKYFIMKTDLDWNRTIMKMADTSDINMYIRVVIQGLRTPMRTPMVAGPSWKTEDTALLAPEAVARFWTGHSPDTGHLHWQLQCRLIRDEGTFSAAGSWENMGVTTMSSPLSRLYMRSKGLLPRDCWKVTRPMRK
jgi:hypothetical protein